MAVQLSSQHHGTPGVCFLPETSQYPSAGLHDAHVAHAERLPTASFHLCIPTSATRYQSSPKTLTLCRRGGCSSRLRALSYVASLACYYTYAYVYIRIYVHTCTYRYTHALFLDVVHSEQRSLCPEAGGFTHTHRLLGSHQTRMGAEPLPCEQQGAPAARRRGEPWPRAAGAAVPRRSSRRGNSRQSPSGQLPAKKPRPPARPLSHRFGRTGPSLDAASPGRAGDMPVVPGAQSHESSG